MACARAPSSPGVRRVPSFSSAVWQDMSAGSKPCSARTRACARRRAERAVADRRRPPTLAQRPVFVKFRRWASTPVAWAPATMLRSSWRAGAHRVAGEGASHVHLGFERPARSTSGAHVARLLAPRSPDFRHQVACQLAVLSALNGATFGQRRCGGSCPEMPPSRHTWSRHQLWGRCDCRRLCRSSPTLIRCSTRGPMCDNELTRNMGATGSKFGEDKSVQGSSPCSAGPVRSLPSRLHRRDLRRKRLPSCKSELWEPMSGQLHVRPPSRTSGGDGKTTNVDQAPAGEVSNLETRTTADYITLGWPRDLPTDSPDGRAVNVPMLCTVS